MLFSHPELVELMVQRFECAWQSLRPVPQVSIDFGEGVVLERTLGGNVLTWFCLADGRAFDVQPGVLTVEAYRAVLERALAIHAQLMAAGEGARAELARSIARAEARGWLEFVELSLGGVFSGVLPELSNGALDRLPMPFPSQTSPPGFADFVSKSAVERPVLEGLDAWRDRVAGLSTLESDSHIAREQLRPRALGILGMFPLSRPSDLSRHVYRAILGIDPLDPYLGLAPFMQVPELVLAPR